jgi:hypothetical protein
MEKELKQKITYQLIDRDFNEKQIEVVIKLLDAARIKKLEDSILVLQNEINKIKNIKNEKINKNEKKYSEEEIEKSIQEVHDMNKEGYYYDEDILIELKKKLFGDEK